MFKYLAFSFSITIISWIVGMLIDYFLRKTNGYNKRFSNFNFLTSKKINNIIGIGFIKWTVKNTFFKFFNPNLKVKNESKKVDLLVLRDEMTKSEIGHLVGFLLVSIFVLLKIYTQNYLFALILMMTNIVLNLYPSLLQQLNKRRIDKAIPIFHPNTKK